MPNMKNTKNVSITATNGKVYDCRITADKDQMDLEILDEAGTVVLSTSVLDKIDALSDSVAADGKDRIMTPEQMSFYVEQNGVSMRVIFQYAGINAYNSDRTYDVNMFILLRFS